MQFNAYVIYYVIYIIDLCCCTVALLKPAIGSTDLTTMSCFPRRGDEISLTTSFRGRKVRISGRFFGIFDERYIDRRRFSVSDQLFSPHRLDGCFYPPDFLFAVAYSRDWNSLKSLLKIKTVCNGFETPVVVEVFTARDLRSISPVFFFKF